MAGITQVSNDENLDGIVRDRQQHALARATSETDDASGITRMEWEKRATAEGIEPAFMAKVEVLNAAIREIGMGRYQYELFFTAGFGWFADNIWLQAIALLQPQIANEFIAQPYVKLSTLALYVGLIVGAFFWGSSCDVVGRRLAWNCTLLVGGIFGLVAGAAPNFTVFCVFIALLGFGVGGNLPVDGTMFIEFLPGAKQWLLTLLSAWWAIGQVVGTLVGWAFVAKYNCTPPPDGFCPRSENMGWRYTYFTLGALLLFLWAIRFFVCPVYESPKFLASVGKDAQAVEVIQQIAKRNKVHCSLTLADLQKAAAPYLAAQGVDAEKVETKFTTWELIRHSFDEFSGRHIRSLFSTRRLAWSTSLVILTYALLGLAYPLFNGFLGSYLATKTASVGDSSIDAAYATYTYQAACGVPGSILAAILVEWGRGGRKFALAFFTIAAGVFLFGLTQTKNSVQVNVLTCLASFFENAMYGVLFAYAPEVFPTPSRGTGDALASTASRVTGLLAPIIAIYTKAAETADGPVFTSAAIFVVAGLVVLLYPIETKGKTAL